MSTKNLYNDEAKKKIKDIVEDVRYAMLATNLKTQPINVVPMYTKKVDENGNIWFLSGMNSDHNTHILKNNSAQLLYSGGSEKKFLSVYGHIEIITDNAVISEIYGSTDDAYLNGPEDPNATALKFIPSEAAYWNNDDNTFVTLFKLAKAAVTGKNQDIGTTGKMKV